MLIIDESLIELEDAADNLVSSFLKLPIVQTYLIALAEFEENDILQDQISQFVTLKESFEENEAYLAYRPEIRELKRKMLKQKRLIDTNPLVLSLRESQLAVQKELSNLAESLAQSVSEDIFVDRALPFYPHKRPHKAGENIIERT
ncbi:YlbF family regulator [Streptococcus saliviloxodontae]|uniref:Cell fate (Sporulation/competence/biofilm development) regulator YlbF (YheA/YmcA/DUF963 family) n=1 Tax=Streptococcus saliviloxodontae TaxID=1349416 RepID=A0ABS2PM73_9STRE|nr:YlbF family regulator [Streptococcus saliviloxodontae]MBM7636196.1 cell fate (sporulation/competence/biofilm development) regulator YlbF (YheA/YmcA/DUF963 family) [Streptococcus saliviloxodontae]